MKWAAISILLHCPSVHLFAIHENFNFFLENRNFLKHYENLYLHLELEHLLNRLIWLECSPCSSRIYILDIFYFKYIFFSVFQVFCNPWLLESLLKNPLFQMPLLVAHIRLNSATNPRLSELVEQYWTFLCWVLSPLSCWLIYHEKRNLQVLIGTSTYNIYRH